MVNFVKIEWLWRWTIQNHLLGDVFISVELNFSHFRNIFGLRLLVLRLLLLASYIFLLNRILFSISLCFNLFLLTNLL